MSRRVFGWVPEFETNERLQRKMRDDLDAMISAQYDALSDLGAGYMRRKRGHGMKNVTPREPKGQAALPPAKDGDE